MIKDLQKRRAHNNVAARKYRENHPDRRKFIQAPRYGTTKLVVESRLSEQENRCGVCHKVFEKTPHIDHDHRTNKFRGLLCKPCNHLLGNAQDSVIILEHAIQYLKKYGVTNEEAPIQSHGD